MSALGVTWHLHDAHGLYISGKPDGEGVAIHLDPPEGLTWSDCYEIVQALNDYVPPLKVGARVTHVGVSGHEYVIRHIDGPEGLAWVEDMTYGGGDLKSHNVVLLRDLRALKVGN